MKWLMTHTLGGDSSANYVRWLARLSISCDRFGPADPAAADARPYDALLLTGGVDVDPVLYHEERAPETKDVRRDRDDMELRLIELFLAARRPIFGVCRGIQILNVAFGGKLIQHIPAVLGESEEHRRLNKKDSSHSIRVVDPSVAATSGRRSRRSETAATAHAGRLADALNGVTEVNSAHHQAVDPAHVGKGLRVCAVSGGGIIEAAEGDGLPVPVIAVQWHPERLPADDPASMNILRLMRDMASNP